MIKKYKIFMIFLLTLSIFALQFTKAKSLPLSGKIITVDPGHGGRDPGTMYHKIMEKDINLEISKVLTKELKSLGATVYLIRNSDDDLNYPGDGNKKRSDLYRRIIFIQNKKSDIYLSIHLNRSSNYTVKGAEVLYNSINKKNRYLGKAILDNLKTDLGTTRTLITTDLYIYRNTRTPGVLIECGFLSNSIERSNLQTPTYQKKLSKSISNGVIEYFFLEKTLK